MAPKKASSIVGLEELTNNKNGLGKALIAEALGVFFINYFGCLSCMKPAVQHINFTISNDVVTLCNETIDQTVRSSPISVDSNTLVIALSFGLVVFILVQTLAHVSGAHLNPAVTIGLLVSGKITLVRGVLYIIVQCLGAIAGSGVLQLLVPGELGATKPSVDAGRALGLEFFLGFILVFVVCGVCDPNKPFIKLNAALAIGLTVAVGHLTTVNLTGSSMNPARSLGAAVLTGTWDCHWVYWVGPCLGGAVASLIYNFLLAAPAVGEYTPVNIEEKELKRLDEKNEDGLA